MLDTTARPDSPDSPDIRFITLPPEERRRELALREHFERFWRDTPGEPRAVYDAFIGACPLAEGVGLAAVAAPGVRGWWLRPAGAEATAHAILYLHGGGYVLGSADAYRGFVSQLVARTGLPALLIDYPLAPEASLPAAPDAALAACRWLGGQGVGTIAVAGDSAGGGLSLVTLAQLTKLGGSPRAVAGVVFSPWTDLAFTGTSMVDPAVVDPLISHAYLLDCAAGYLGGAAPTDPLASPLHGELAGLPPLLIQVGTDERLLDDARQYAGRAARAGVAVSLEIWEGMHHVFQLDLPHLDSSKAALERAAEFILGAFRSA
ncbi:alpha/beta hydrolase fold domain-containing protein [Burkholderia gladioli]|uniref:alpha/beta hydrolase fold domain-containing protein n=1 Tax=Burkholderia gladioli TaxID=28095 RepID=UPI0016411097|nr:alpha/beta hydrolase [Burkholderia gladioli]